MIDEDGTIQQAGGTDGDEVLHEGRVVGRVRRFTMGAGQFGTTWVARAEGGEQRTGFATREAAVAWLAEIDARHDRS
jgi:hypothetical protein